jgi:hypothetical protein
VNQEVEECERQVTNPEFFEDFQQHQSQEGPQEKKSQSEEQSTDSQEDLPPTALPKPRLTRADQLDMEMERLRYGDEYQGPSDFVKQVKTINFNFNTDDINGVYELDENMGFEGHFDQEGCYIVDSECPIMEQSS